MHINIAGFEGVGIAENGSSWRQCCDSTRSSLSASNRWRHSPGNGNMLQGDSQT